MDGRCATENCLILVVNVLAVNILVVNRPVGTVKICEVKFMVFWSLKPAVLGRRGPGHGPERDLHARGALRAGGHGERDSACSSKSSYNSSKIK